MNGKIKCMFIMALSLTMIGCSSNKNVTSTNNNNSKETAVLPNDRENIVKPISSVYTSEDLAKGIIKGDWAIEKVNGKDAVGEKAPFIKFSPDDKRIYGNNGCNVIGAQFNYNPQDSTIRFEYLTSTMILCHQEGITDREINLALDEARHYSWRLEDNDFYMTFYNEANEPVMELMHQNFQFLNGTWLVKKIEGEDVNVPNMKLVFDVDEGKIHGNTGCNIINGALEINMKAANSISIQSLTKTLRACPDDNYETRLLMALEEAMKAKQLKGMRAELLDGSNKQVLLLERTSDK